MGLTTNGESGLQPEIPICPDPLVVARLACDMRPYKERFAGRASVHYRNEKGRAPHWICRCRRSNPENGRTVHRTIKLASEQHARALQLVLSQWRADHEAERDARRAERQTRQQERQLLRDIRDNALNPELLGPRAVRRGRKAFLEAGQQGCWGLGTYALANPRGYLGQPGRPSAMTRLRKCLLNTRPPHPMG